MLKCAAAAAAAFPHFFVLFLFTFYICSLPYFVMVLFPDRLSESIILIPNAQSGTAPGFLRHCEMYTVYSSQGCVFSSD